MIMINENWEQINSVDDIVRICRENIGSEFADIVHGYCDTGRDEEIVNLQDEIEDLEREIDELEGDNANLQSECENRDILEEKVNCLETAIDNLESYIDENADGTDFMMGMEKALVMIREELEGE